MRDCGTAWTGVRSGPARAAWRPRVRAALLAACCLAGVAVATARSAAADPASGAAEMDADLSGTAAAWVPGNADSPAPQRVRIDGDSSLRFSLPFAALKDWRFTWDQSGHWDLSGAQRLVLRLRSSGPGCSGLVDLYAQSGAGWWRFPPVALSEAWRDVALDRSQAAAEGTPSGWRDISTLRLSVLPGGGDGWMALASIEPQAQLPEPWVWQVGGARSREAFFRLALKGAGPAAARDVRKRLTQAEGILAKARERGLRGAERRKALLEARAKAEQAWALGQSPLKPGLRAVWVHNGDGPRAYGGDRAARWKDAIPRMHALGVNTLIPNMLWSGVAFYPSAIVPNAPGVASEGDYLQEILDAAKPLGMKVFVWKVMWQFAEGWLAPDGVSQPFRAAGRLQFDAHGKELPWLCPCDERNRKLELDALLEVARRYPIDGIQLDYIRFEGPDAGFGTACKARFEAFSGKHVASWPQDCAPGGPLAGDYAAFKVDLISGFVRDASVALRAARPGLVLSAAVFPSPKGALAQVSQDWPRWLREGWLDLAFPMSYTEDAATFAAETRDQAALVGAGRIVPGLQVSFEGGRVAGLASVVDQLRAEDAAGAPGVALFEWREQLQDTLLPYLRAGLWREGAYALDFRTPAPGQVPPEPVPGPRPEGRPAVLRLDDFESGRLANALGAPWSAQADANRLGTRLDAMPLSFTAGGAQGSAHALGLRGHFGANRAPWPYADLVTAFNPDRSPVDLDDYSRLVFDVRGDGRPLQVTLKRSVVTDYGDFRAEVATGPDWKECTLELESFAQPGWAAPRDRDWCDVTALLFSPGSRNDEDFWFDVDNVRFER